MTEPILVAVAWPYANAQIHVGNLTGAYLSADIFEISGSLMKNGADLKNILDNIKITQ